MPPLGFQYASATELEALERGWWRELVGRVTGHAGESQRFDEYFDSLYAHFREPGAWQVYDEVVPLLELRTV